MADLLETIESKTNSYAEMHTLLYSLKNLTLKRGFLGASGDFIAQKFIEKRRWKNYDYIRTGRFIVLTGVYIAPMLVGWFRILERVRGSAKLVPLKRLLIDQVAFAPFFLATILFTLRTLEGKKSSDAWENVKKDYLPILKFNLAFWPPVQLFNFYLMPLNFRVIIVQLGSLVWNTYVSYKTQKSLDKPVTKLLESD